MVEQHQYLTAALSPADALSEETPGLSDGCVSSISGYPELTSFSAESTFTLPAHCEPNLLTPISTIESPPLHDIGKFMGQYPPPPGSPHIHQEHTPPESSKMYPQWNSHFEMNSHASETSSPMHTPAQAGQDFYLTEDRRTPGPPEPYMGSFGVSDTSQPHHIPHSSGPSPYFLDMAHLQAGQTTGMLLRDGNPSIKLESQHRELNRSGPLSTPLLHDAPRSSGMRRTKRQASEDDTHGPDSIGSPGSSPRRRSTLGNNRVTKKTKTKRGKNSQSETSEDHLNCLGQEVPPVLKETCPDEERCIFESRWRHRNKRGQDMWDSIQSDFLKEFNKSHGKEMLQMKFKRARSKYIQWINKDEDILREAWKKLEQDRYQLLLDTFIEMGGSRNMRLNASDIEVKVVNDLKLEENMYMDSFRDMDIRRRRKMSAKKRGSTTGRGGRSGDDDLMPIGDGLSLSLEAHNPHLEDDVINQVHGRPRFEPSPDQHAAGIMDMQHLWDSRGINGLQPRMINGVPGSRPIAYPGSLPAGACL